MHRRHENLPSPVWSRGRFLLQLIEIQQIFELPMDTILIVLEAADRFITTKPKEPKASKTSGKRYYSQALAYALYILVEKYNVDRPYFNMKDISDTLGINLAPLEKEIFQDLDFLFQRYNVFSFVTLLTGLPTAPVGPEPPKNLGLPFYALLIKIANNTALMYANPHTLLLAIVLLMRRKKLSLDNKNLKPMILFNYLQKLPQISRDEREELITRANKIIF